MVLQLFQLCYKTSEFTAFFVLIFLEKIKAALTPNPVHLVANVSVHWIGGKILSLKTSVREKINTIHCHQSSCQSSH